MSHRDCVLEAPEGFEALAASPGSPVAALESRERALYGIQFHPEVVHTPYGTEVLERFLREIVGCQERWSPASVTSEQVEKIKAQVGDAEVICGLSGGVDSATAAALVHRAIGDQLTCVLVDHGLMRKNECEQVVKAFREELGIKLIHVDAEARFLERLAGETEPEAKRKIIGSEFIRVFEDEARKLSDAKFLVQGTLYSDVIEFGGERHGAATIKSHHNVGASPTTSRCGDMATNLRRPVIPADTERGMGELLVALVIFGSGVAANELSPHPKTFSIERADCARPTSLAERRACDVAKRLDRRG